MRGVLMSVLAYVPAVGVIGRAMLDIERLEKSGSRGSLPKEKR